MPCLSPESWKKNVIAGDRWALVGDAAGLTDPITGEGIYFAFRSAEILAETSIAPRNTRKRSGKTSARSCPSLTDVRKVLYRAISGQQTSGNARFSWPAEAGRCGRSWKSSSRETSPI